MYVLVSRIKENNNLLGYAIYNDIDNKAQLVPLRNSIQVIASGKVKVLNARFDGEDLVGTNGSLARLPDIDRNGKLTTKNIITILNEVVDEKGSLLGYDILNYKGDKARYRESDVIKLYDLGGISNGKVPDKTVTKRFVSSINGSYNQVLYVPTPKGQSKEELEAKRIAEAEEAYARKYAQKRAKEEDLRKAREQAEDKAKEDAIIAAEMREKARIESARQSREDAARRAAEAKNPGKHSIEDIKKQAIDSELARNDSTERVNLLLSSDSTEDLVVLISDPSKKPIDVSIRRYTYNNLVTGVKKLFMEEVGDAFKATEADGIASQFVKGNITVAFNNSYVKNMSVSRYIKLPESSQIISSIIKLDDSGNKSIDTSHPNYQVVLDSIINKYGAIESKISVKGLFVEGVLPRVYVDEYGDIQGYNGIRFKASKSTSLGIEDVREITEEILRIAN